MNKLPPHDHTFDNGRAILTNAEVNEVRDRYKNGERQCDLAREYGVSKANIKDIVRYRRRRNSNV